MKTFIDTINFGVKNWWVYPYCNLPDVHTAGKLCRTECFV